MRHALEANNSHRIDQHRVRDALDFNGVRGAALGVASDRIIDFGISHRADLLLGFLRESNHHQLLFQLGRKLVQVRNGFAAGTAPGCPEIYQHKFPLHVRRLAQPLLHGNFRRGLVEERFCMDRMWRDGILRLSLPRWGSWSGSLWGWSLPHSLGVKGVALGLLRLPSLGFGRVEVEMLLQRGFEVLELRRAHAPAMDEI